MHKDFLDITFRILVLIRSDIENELNVEILKILVDSILKKKSAGEVAYIIRQFSPSYSEMLGLLSTGNENRKLTIEEEEVYSSVMKYALNLLKELISGNQFKYAYDIADSIHAFPEIFEADDHMLKQYWNAYIKPVRKKWDKHLFDDVRQYLGQR